MFVQFFHHLKSAGLPVSLREYLTLMEAMAADVPERSVDHFYYLARATLIKDERNLDIFDRLFAHHFKGVSQNIDPQTMEIPEDWLALLNRQYLTEEERAKIEAMGGWDKLMETLQKRLEEQKERHEGGNKWIGTGGTSPFGHGGYNPEGIRIGGQSTHRRAAKVWEKRQFKDLDDTREMGTRALKMGLRKLRQLARTGAAEEFDLDGTIDATARQAYLDIQMRPERRNAVKVLLFFDVGGSMDGHVRQCEELFSAARSEFKHMEYFYFHNCLYDFVWKQNARRQQDRIPTWDILHTYGSDYKVIFVGDAAMSPYEITVAGGSVEYFNEEPGAVWLQRLLDVYSSAVWLNPTPQAYWEHSHSTHLIHQLFDGRMYPLSVKGIDAAVASLKRVRH